MEYRAETQVRLMNGKQCCNREWLEKADKHWKEERANEGDEVKADSRRTQVTGLRLLNKYKTGVEAGGEKTGGKIEILGKGKTHKHTYNETEMTGPTLAFTTLMGQTTLKKTAWCARTVCW